VKTLSLAMIDCDFLPHAQRTCSCSNLLSFAQLCHSLKRCFLPQVFVPGTRVGLDNSSKSYKINTSHLICRKVSVFIKNILYHNQIQSQLKGNLFSGASFLWVQENIPFVLKHL
jgi:hypothetical protein